MFMKLTVGNVLVAQIVFISAVLLGVPDLNTKSIP